MALKKCKECGEEISKKAASCPKCGSPSKKKTSLFTWLILVLIIFVYIGWSNAPPGQTSKTNNITSSSSQILDAKKQTNQEPVWTYRESKDKMSGERNMYASSPTIQPSEAMNFPYNNVSAWLGVGCNGKDEWAYIGFSVAPNLTDTETHDGYNTVNVRVKWGEKLTDMKFTQKWSASFLHFTDDTIAIAGMVAVDKVLVELQWHGERKTYFEFPLKGSGSAISKIEAACEKF